MTVANQLVLAMEVNCVIGWQLGGPRLEKGRWWDRMQMDVGTGRDASRGGAGKDVGEGPLTWVLVYVSPGGCGGAKGRDIKMAEVDDRDKHND